MSMVTRKILIALLLLCCTSGTWAQDAMQRLVVWQKSGEKTYFDLTEEPETTFESGKLVIKTSKTTVTYQLSNVLRYTYEGLMTAIGSPKMPEGELVFRQGRDEMLFDGLADGTRLDVFTTDGRLLFTRTARTGETTVVSLAGQPDGTYIVKMGDATYKFLKR